MENVSDNCVALQASPTGFATLSQIERNPGKSLLEASSVPPAIDRNETDASNPTTARQRARARAAFRPPRRPEDFDFAIRDKPPDGFPRRKRPNEEPRSFSRTPPRGWLERCCASWRRMGRTCRSIRTTTRFDRPLKEVQHGTTQ
jgi:hypothetical protein